MKFQIKKLTSGDASVTAAMEKKIFGTPWSETLVLDTIEKAEGEASSKLAYGAFGAWIDGALAGYLFSMSVAGEGELHRIAVDENYRKMGIAGKLMERFFSWLQECSADTAFLEVRAGNRAAVSLYKKYGFEEEGRRKAYYHNPREDALIFRCHQFPLSYPAE